MAYITQHFSEVYLNRPISTIEYRELEELAHDNGYVTMDPSYGYNEKGQPYFWLSILFENSEDASTFNDLADELDFVDSTKLLGKLKFFNTKNMTAGWGLRPV